MKKNDTLQFFQKLCRAFLVPLSLLAAASLMLAVGGIFQQQVIIDLCPAFFANRLVSYIATVFVWAGLMMLRNLGFFYAVALAFALAKEEKGYAAFGAGAGYIAFLASMNILLICWPEIKDAMPANAIATVFGFETINCGILGGILTGLVCSFLHNRFKDIKLPMAFSFYQGVRFVPIVCLVAMTAIGQVFPFGWLYFAKFIEWLGSILNSLGSFSVFLYAICERALIPTGLHQIWNVLVRNTAISGTYTFASGITTVGVVESYAAYLSEGLPISPAGTTIQEMVKYYFGPQIPMMLGGLPAIALAIYQCADDDKKSTIKPLVVTGVMCTVFAAVSEPIEFIFLFVAPLLYVLYSLLTGLSWWLCYVLGSGVGGGESHIFGFFIHGVLRENSNWWVIVVVTIIEFIACYLLFKWYIVKFDVKTPGRGGDYDDSLAFAAEIANVDSPNATGEKEETIDTTNPGMMKAQIIIRGLGGKDNIEEVDSCMTRLRVNVKDITLVDEKALNTTGCSGFVKPGGNEIQIIYGPSVMMIKKNVRKLLGM